MTWNDEQIELLKKLWNEGLSSTVIASRIGGISRNAVIGKIHRLGLSGRYYNPPRTPYTNMIPKAPRRRTVAKASRKPSPVQILFGKPFSPVPLEPLPLPAPHVTDVGRVAIMDLEPHHCRYPIGDGPNLRFCGDSKFPGLTYCEHHARRCYHAPNPQDRRKTSFRTGLVQAQRANGIDPNNCVAVNLKTMEEVA